MSELTERAEAVRDETRVGYNTARVVGGLLADMAASMDGIDLGRVTNKDALTERNSGRYTGVFEGNNGVFYLFVSQYPVGMRRGCQQMLISATGVEVRSGQQNGIVTTWTAWKGLMTASEMPDALREMGVVVGERCVAIGMAAEVPENGIVIGDMASSDMYNSIVIGNDLFAIADNETVMQVGRSVKRIRNYSLADLVSLRDMNDAFHLGLKIEDIYPIVSIKGLVNISLELPDGAILNIVKAVDFTAMKNIAGMTSVAGDNLGMGVDLNLGHIYVTGAGEVGLQTGNGNVVHLIVELYH